MPEIRAAFSQAPALTVKHLNRAIQRSMLQIERDSKLKTPVDTGFLRASHRTLFTQLRGELEPRADYAIYVHEGARYMKSRPFLFDAVNENERFVQQEFEKAVQNVLDDIARWV